MKLIQNHKSPNIQQSEISTEFVVIHYTACDLKRTLEIFLDPATKVSSHFVIDLNGDCYDLGGFFDGPIRQGAHAGVSQIQIKDVEYKSLNEISVGVEVVNPNGNIFSYTDAQYESLKVLLQKLISRFPSLQSSQRIIGHEHIASKRGKADPGVMFDWNRLFASLGMEADKIHSDFACDPSDILFLKSNIPSHLLSDPSHIDWSELSMRLEKRIKDRNVGKLTGY